MANKSLLQAAGDGTAIPSGYVGEVVEFDWLSPAMPAANTIVNAWSKTLSAGVWQIFGGVAVFAGGGGAVYSVDNYIAVSISDTFGGSNTRNRTAGILPNANSNTIRGVQTSQVFALSTSKTIYVTVAHGITTVGAATITNSYINGAYAVRIA